MCKSIRSSWLNSCRSTRVIFLACRSGWDTEQYIIRVVNRITVFGALFLGAISVLPFLLLSGVGLTSVYLGGTSLLIIVGVAMQVMQQMEGQLLQRNYRGFIR